MSGHAYLTFFADAPGESPAVGHEDWIELLSWTWGVTRDRAGPGGGSGGGAGRPDPSALVWEHVVRRGIARGCSGSWHPAGTSRRPSCTSRAAAATAAVTRGSSCKMQDVTITSVTTTGSAEGDVEQTVGMEFRSVRFEYRRQRPDGSLGDARDVRLGHPPGHGRRPAP